MLKVDQFILQYLDAEKQLIDLIYRSGTIEKKKLYALIKKQEKLLFNVRQEYKLYGETGEIRIVEIENAEQKLEKWNDIMKNKVGWNPKQKELINQGEKDGTK